MAPPLEVRAAPCPRRRQSSREPPGWRGRIPSEPTTTSIPGRTPPTASASRYPASRPGPALCPSKYEHLRILQSNRLQLGKCKLKENRGTRTLRSPARGEPGLDRDRQGPVPPPLDRGPLDREAEPQCKSSGLNRRFDRPLDFDFDRAEARRHQPKQIFTSLLDRDAGVNGKE